jgi:alpha-amylase/alpha-mannosidase (GH57 family)
VSKFERSYLCVHGHFSQPPRGNPLNNVIGVEPEADPYPNWNERITAQSYRPNAERGNFDHISFSFAEGLVKWLQANAPDVYQALLKADQQTAAAHAPAGNALATAYNHIILPLARKRDKRTQIYWGISAFEERYGRKPLGFWLPEMAVDIETLRLLVEAGIQYTVLAEKQILDLPPGSGAGPYRVQLSDTESIAVFVRHDRLSAEISFNIHTLGGAGSWCDQVLSPARKHVGPLLLLAMAGETFGHHYAGEEEFLYWLVKYEAARAGYRIITLDQYFAQNPPKRTVRIKELSSWGNYEGLTQWLTGYANQHQDTTWKGALRRALDNAASEVDRVYEELVRLYHADPWMLRNQYAPVILGAVSADDFITENIPQISPEHRQQLEQLFFAQRLTQRMYNSYTFTDDRLEGRQPRYAVACAAAALTLAQKATGQDLNDRFPLDMAVVRSNTSATNGTAILNSVLEEFNLDLLKS